MDIYGILKAKAIGNTSGLSHYDALIASRFIGGGTLIGTDSEPYLYRSSPSLGAYKTERDEIVGVSVGFNQLAYNGDFASTSCWGENTDQRNIVLDNGKGKIAPTNNQSYLQVVTNNDFYGKAEFLSGRKYFVSAEFSSDVTLTKISPFMAASWTQVASKDVTTSAKSVNFATILSASGSTSNNARLGFTVFGTFVGGSSYLYIDNVMLIDLTALSGTTIVDYIYSLEQGTAGSGVAFFRKYFGADYYPYDSGSIRSVEGLVSHDMVGFNQWDEEWEVGSLIDGANDNTRSDVIRSKNYIKVIPSTNYNYNLASKIYAFYYDADKNLLSTFSCEAGTVNVLTTPSNAHYLRFRTVPAYGTTYKNDICINISDADLNGQYKPYEKHSYPLDSTVTLRGLLKLDNGKLKADGDIYKADGSVTRKYGIVDMGTLNWRQNGTTEPSQFFAPLPNSVSDISGGTVLCAKYSSGDAYDRIDKTICRYGSSGYIWLCDSAYSDASALIASLNGVMLVYELATPTTEQAQPFAKNQKVSPSGTEEYVTTSVVPIGHNTEYYG